jgi:hypothetical protein
MKWWKYGTNNDDKSLLNCVMAMIIEQITSIQLLLLL